jgi:hypothetical protein
MDEYEVYTFDTRMPVYQYDQYATQVNRRLTVTDILSKMYEYKQSDRVYCFEMYFLKNNMRLTYGRVRVQNNIALSQTPGCCWSDDPCRIISPGCCVLSYLCQQQNTSTSTRRIWDYMCGYYGITIDCKVLQFLREIRENVTHI